MQPQTFSLLSCPRPSNQRAFTLIELLVVILIIGILIAVAAPSFLGHQDKARDLDAEQAVMVAIKAGQGAYLGGDDHWPSVGSQATSSSLLGQMKATEPHLSFRAFGAADYSTYSTGPRDISVSLEDSGSTLRACAKSITERVYCAAWTPQANLTVIPGPTYTAQASGGLLGVEVAHASSRPSDSGTVRVTGANEFLARAALPRPASAGTRDGVRADLHFNSRIKPLPLAPLGATPPTVTGPLYVGETLTGTDGTWLGTTTTFSRQWQRCSSTSTSSCSNISGATSATYELRTADLGQRMRLVVSASNDGGENTAASALVGPVLQLANVTPPAIVGTPAVGTTLTANPGTWTSPLATFTYQWDRCTSTSAASCTPISGATNLQYVSAAPDGGAYLRLEVIARHGDGQGTANSPIVAVPAPVAATTSFVQTVAVGTYHSCAITASGGVRCWGRAVNGALGNGSSSGNALSPVAVTGIANATQISAHHSHSCAVLTTGAVKCWGDNGYAQSGPASGGSIATVPATLIPSGARAVSAGYLSTCVLMNDGTVKCAGAFSDIPSGSVFTVAGVAGAVSIANIQYAACAALSNGTVKCWGNNGSGQLGVTAPTTSATPVTVQGISNAVAVVPGSQNMMCAIRATGAVKCWGYGYMGTGAAIGYGAASTTADVGQNNLLGVVGGDGTCALKNTGDVRCWGSNTSGRLGDGTTTDKTTPVAVAGVSGATSVGLGNGSHGCAMLQSNAVRCWGNNIYGQLGNGTTTNSLAAVSVTGF